jgi:prepilin signal peptidase PulO-like enzyme (type II secretory pathway)
VATIVDFEHYIIPDEITLGGVAAGFLCSFLVPMLQHADNSTGALRRSFLGIVIGAGLVYAIVRGGKLLFGRQRFAFPSDTQITFTETTLQLPDREVPYEELFYRKSDAVVFRAKTLELYARAPAVPGSESKSTAAAAPSPSDVPRAVPMADPEPATTLEPESVPTAEPAPSASVVPEPTLPPGIESPPPMPVDPNKLSLTDRTCQNVLVRLQPHKLCIDEEVFNPEEVMRMVAVTGEIVVPREAMGFGDVKFMAAIGAFLGAPAALFSLLLSAMIGSLVGVTLIVVRRREWSSRLPYGPYIALAAILWVFGDTALYDWWVGQLNVLLSLFGARV